MIASSNKRNAVNVIRNRFIARLKRIIIAGWNIIIATSKSKLEIIVDCVRRNIYIIIDSYKKLPQNETELLQREK